jgi:hypothetical protein
MKLTEVEAQLETWQQAVVETIDNHARLIDGEEYQSMSDYDINMATHTRIKMPGKAGHTTLAAYLGARYSARIVYTSYDHLLEIQGKIENAPFEANDSAFISVYEIFYAIVTRNDGKKTLTDVDKLKKKFDAQVVVIDRASEVPASIIDFVFTVTTGQVILLG